MGRATTGHEVDDQDALGCDRRLREQSEPARHLLGGQAVDLLAVEDHVPGARAQQAGEGAQEGRLAAGVGSDDHGDLAVGHRQGETVDDRAVVVRETDVFGAQTIAARPAGRRTGAHNAPVRAWRVSSQSR